MLMQIFPIEHSILFANVRKLIDEYCKNKKKLIMKFKIKNHNGHKTKTCFFFHLSKMQNLSDG